MKGRARDHLTVRDEAVARLAGGDVPPLLVVAGPDPFLREPVVAAALAGAGAEAEVFAPRAGEGDAAAARRLVNAWTTASLFGGGGVLLARDAGRLLRAQGEALLEVADPPQRLVVTTGEIDGRTKLARALKKADALVSLPPLRDAPPPWQVDGDPADTELVRWLLDRARARGLALDRRAAHELALRVGNEPAVLAQRLEQLAVLLGEDGIDADAVRAHVRPTGARLLALYEAALREGDAGSALQCLDRMGIEGVYDPFGRLVTGPELADAVLRGLVTSLARTLEAHERLSPDAVASLARPPWKRSPRETEELDAALGRGGPRVFVERDLRLVGRRAARSAFPLALDGLRALRDGRGVSLHGLTVRLARAVAAGRGA